MRRFFLFTASFIVFSALAATDGLATDKAANKAKAAVETAKEKIEALPETAKDEAKEGVSAEAAKMPMPEAEAVPAPAPEAAPLPPLAEILEKDAAISAFYGWLKKAELIKKIEEKTSQHTLFVPTNEAFKAIEKKLEELEKAGHKQMISDVLNFHIVNGMVPRQALDNNSSEVLSTTLKRLRVVGKDGKLTVNDIKVDDKEETAANGIVYKIDGIIGADVLGATVPETPAAKSEEKAESPASPLVAAEPEKAEPEIAEETPQTEAPKAEEAQKPAQPAEKKKSIFKFW